MKWDLLVVLLVVVGLVLAYGFKDLKNRKRLLAIDEWKRLHPGVSSDDDDTDADLDFNVETVGESFYKPAFKRLFRAELAEDDEQEVQCEAVLRLEPDNPHDAQAVGVYIRGKKVAHLDRSTARDYRKLPKTKESGGERSVPAEVYLGGPEGIFSCRLCIPEL